MTLSGTLTDFEGTTIRIDDKPYPATAHVMKVCSVVLGKKARVDYKIEEKDGIQTVTDIRKHQEGQQPAPASTAPQQQEKKETPCTSPTTPAAAAFWSIPGVVETIDAAARKVSVSDEAGSITPLVWPEGYLDKAFGKLKPGYYREFGGETGSQRIASVKWIEGEMPAWVKAKYAAMNPKTGGSGGRPYTPRNEKPMIYESAFKSCAELVRPDDFKGMDYAARVEAVRVEAEKIAKWMITNGGA